MNFSLYPDTHNFAEDCDDHFPSGLSSFLEKMFGHKDYSEVSQISQILNIDLNIFKNYAEPEPEPLSSSPYWLSVEMVILVLEDFINKINAKPFYWKEVKQYPDDLHSMIKYLSSNEIISDLKELIRILKCYRTKEIKKVMIMYF